jgi:hypothetical protein
MQARGLPSQPWQNLPCGALESQDREVQNVTAEGASVGTARRLDVVRCESEHVPAPGAYPAPALSWLTWDVALELLSAQLGGPDVVVALELVARVVERLHQPQARPGVRVVPPFTFNCDIATPMLRRRDAVYAVDLWLDVLVRDDGVTHAVYDHHDFEEAIRRGLLSEREVAGR